MATFLGRGRKVMLSSRVKQSALATAAAVDYLFRVSSDPGNLEWEMSDDTDLVGGTEEPTTQEVSIQRYNLPFDQSKVKPHTLAFVLAAGLGSVSSATPAGGTNSRLHTITQKSTTDFDTFTAEELYATGHQKKYIGCILDSFTLTGDRSNFWTLSAQIYGSGKVATGSASVTEVSEVSLHTRDTIAFIYAGSYGGATPDQDVATATGSDLGGGDDVSAEVESLAWTYNNNTDLNFLVHYNSGTTWGRAERGTRGQELSYTLLFQDMDQVDRALAQTSVSMEVKCISKTQIAGIAGQTTTGNDAGYKYGLAVIWPLLKYSAAQIRGAAGDRVTVDVTARVLEDATYGAARAWVWNGIFDYLQ